MKYRMLIPCCPNRVGGADVNLKMYRWCRDHLYEFAGYEKYTSDDGPPLWSWVMEKVLTEREEKLTALAYDTGKWVGTRQAEHAKPAPKQAEPEATSTDQWYVRLVLYVLLPFAAFCFFMAGCVY